MQIVGGFPPEPAAPTAVCTALGLEGGERLNSPAPMHNSHVCRTAEAVGRWIDKPRRACVLGVIVLGSAVVCSCEYNAPQRRRDASPRVQSKRM